MFPNIAFGTRDPSFLRMTAMVELAGLDWRF
jgi:hypothetical protein